LIYNVRREAAAAERAAPVQARVGRRAGPGRRRTGPVTAATAATGAAPGPAPPRCTSAYVCGAAQSRRVPARLGGKRRGTGGSGGEGVWWRMAPGLLVLPVPRRGRTGRRRGVLVCVWLLTPHWRCWRCLRARVRAAPAQALNATGPSVSGLSAASERDKGAPSVAPPAPGPRPLHALKAHKLVNTDQRGPPKHDPPPQGYRPAGEFVCIRMCAHASDPAAWCNCRCAQLAPARTAPRAPHLTSSTLRPKQRTGRGNRTVRWAKPRLACHQDRRMKRWLLNSRGRR
jgi:hypothetical protein